MRPKPLIPLDTDHRGLVKFSSADDPNYIKIISRISEVLQYRAKRSMPSLSSHRQSK